MTGLVDLSKEQVVRHLETARRAAEACIRVVDALEATGDDVSGLRGPLCRSLDSINAALEAQAAG